MFQKLTNSWELVVASARVLSADKELLIFPVISAIGTLIVSLGFLLPMILANGFDAIFSQNLQIVGFIILFLFYIVQYFIIFFCNTALVGAAMIRLKGGDPTLSDGFRIAFSRFGVILSYAVIASTVGMILRTLSQRNRGLARIVSSFLGLAWNLATFLVVPVLAVENVGPIEAIKRSAALLKRTWGEQVVGNLGLGAVFGLVSFLLTLAFLPVFILVVNQVQGWVLPVVVAVLFVLSLMLVGMVQGALNGIYTAAVYQFASTGETGKFFSPSLVQNAVLTQR